MVSSINYYLSSLPGIYDQNNLDLAQTLQKLVSQKNFQTPSDDITDYFRSQDLNEQYDEYSDIKSNLTEWQGVLNTASTAAGEVYNDLQKMQELSQGYASADPAAQAADTSEYSKLFNDISTIINSTVNDGALLLWNQTPLATISLTPSSTAPASQLNINLGQVIGAVGDNSTAYNALNPGGGQNIGNMDTAISNALVDVQGYIGNVSGYQTAIQSHLNITSATMTNLQSFSSTLTNIDQASVMQTYTQQEIMQQAGAAMLAQANLDQRNVLLLYQFPSLQI
jgi:flagellin